MPIEFYCSKCYAQVITPDETAGKQGRCPNCSAVVSIPMPGASPSPGPPSVAAPTPPHPQSQVQPRHQPVDPFKPTSPQQREHSESVQKQFGFDKFEGRKEEGAWGEDNDLSYQMRKTIAKERAQNRLVGPAQTLITLAATNLIAVVIGIIGLIVYVAVQTQQEVEIASWWLTLWIVIIAIVMMDSTMIFIGGNHMRHARSYSMAYTGAVFALLPLNLLFFVTIPFGAWAIATLNDPDVAEGFKRR